MSKETDIKPQEGESYAVFDHKPRTRPTYMLFPITGKDGIVRVGMKVIELKKEEPKEKLDK